MPNDHLPILYSFRRCPYAMRARLAIAASGQRCELREVVLRDKPAALLKASPKATVPVLVVGDIVIDESLDIMLWALRRNDPQHWLGSPAGKTDEHAALMADMLSLIKQCDQVFKAHLDRYKYPERYNLSDGAADRDAAAQWLRDVLDSRLADGHLFGSQTRLADMAIAPFVRQYANTDKTWFQAQQWPRLRTWLDNFLCAPLFEHVMSKYAPWVPGAPAILFPD